MKTFEENIISRLQLLDREVERLRVGEMPIGGGVGETVTLTAGLGLTGGGDLSANRRFDVGAGAGIAVGTDDVRVDLNYNFTWMGVHSFQNITYASSIMPHVSDVYDLGSSASLWRKIWASELSAVVFSQYTQVLLGGWFTVSKGEGVLQAAVSTGATSIVLDTTGVDVGDIIVFRGLDYLASPQVEYMKITGKSGTTYSVTRNLDGSGANAWPAGSVYANYGTTGNGRIELNAYDTPRISVFSHANTIAGYREQVRIGDLINGWGYSTSTYGSAFGAYESGKANITIDPTNGVRIRNYSQTIIQLTGTEASFENVIKLGTYGRLQQGTGTWGTDFTGSAIWNESGVMNIGGWNNNVKQWWGGSDGVLYAGQGDIKINSSGITLNAYNSESWVEKNSIKWSYNDRIFYVMAGLSGGTKHYQELSGPLGTNPLQYWVTVDNLDSLGGYYDIWLNSGSHLPQDASGSGHFNMTSSSGTHEFLIKEGVQDYSYGATGDFYAQIFAKSDWNTQLSQLVLSTFAESRSSYGTQNASIHLEVRTDYYGVYSKIDLSASNINANGNLNVTGTIKDGSGVEYLKSAGWKSYTPTWTASTTNPTLGNGTLTGRYVQIGKLVYCQFKMVAGSTTTFGSGEWRFSYPISPNTSYIDLQVGSSLLADAGVGYYSGVTRYGGATFMTIIVGGVAIHASAPFTWTNGDLLTVNIIYEAA